VKLEDDDDDGSDGSIGATTKTDSTRQRSSSLSEKFGEHSKARKFMQHFMNATHATHTVHVESHRFDDDYCSMNHSEDLTDSALNSDFQMWMAFWRIPDVRVLCHTIFTVVALVLNVIILYCMNLYVRAVTAARARVLPARELSSASVLRSLLLRQTPTLLVCTVRSPPLASLHRVLLLVLLSRPRLRGVAADQGNEVGPVSARLLEQGTALTQCFIGTH
jgi:hypothetical protein